MIEFWYVKAYGLMLECNAIESNGRDFGRHPAHRFQLGEVTSCQSHAKHSHAQCYTDENLTMKWLLPRCHEIVQVLRRAGKARN